MRPTRRNQAIVLTCAFVSLALGLLVAPLGSDGTASWVAVAIGALLIGQWALMTRGTNRT